MTRTAIAVSVLFASLPAWAAVEVPCDAFSLGMPHDAPEPVELAAAHFVARAAILGGRKAEADGSPAVTVSLRLCAGAEPEAAAGARGELENLAGFQRREAYVLAVAADRRSVTALAVEPLGLAHACSDLERRLRVADGRLVLSFPEWNPAAGPWEMLEKPALEVRGEYLNIGYDIPPITPHQWDRPQWRDYVDRLVLARLNHFYFYLWIDAWTMYPGSKLSQQPLNRRLHEELREAIGYARRRGLRVVFMVCPTFWPRDVWEAHPECHADIVYVRHGFCAACPRSPGAWRLMEEIWRSEMEWFRDVDACQIWFYDPGGCWCERHGCAANQAETLHRQVVTFGRLFREFNPRGGIEINLWPIWLWEADGRPPYREDFARQVQRSFAAEAPPTMVGATHADAVLPALEKRMGFETTGFIFEMNHESGYTFLIPDLETSRAAVQRLVAHGHDGGFGHRLEATTRFASTAFMADFMWRPDLTPEAAALRFAAWQTASDSAGRLLADAILLLERFTMEGADADTGRRMAALTRQAVAAAPAAVQPELGHLTAMMDALEVVGATVESPVTDASERFGAALEASPVFKRLAADPGKFFDRYRGLLALGWRQHPF